MIYPFKELILEISRARHGDGSTDQRINCRRRSVAMKACWSSWSQHIWRSHDFRPEMATRSPKWRYHVADNFDEWWWCVFVPNTRRVRWVWCVHLGRFFCFAAVERLGSSAMAWGHLGECPGLARRSQTLGSQKSGLSFQNEAVDDMIWYVDNDLFASQILIYW